MDMKFSSTAEEYLYYEEMVSLTPHKIYVSYYTNKKYTTHYNNITRSMLLDNNNPLWNKYNTQYKYDIVCVDKFKDRDRDEDNYIKRNKRNTKLHKVKIMTLSSLIAVSAVLANNYLLDN